METSWLSEGYNVAFYNMVTLRSIRLFHFPYGPMNYGSSWTFLDWHIIGSVIGRDGPIMEITGCLQPPDIIDCTTT
jgi:hypothetical protein